MPCNPLIEPVCVGSATLFQSATPARPATCSSGIAQAITDGVRWIVANTATWWVQIPSPDLAGRAGGRPAIQQWLLPVTAAVAVGGVIAAGARMAITRRANPLLDVTGGLLTLAAATTLGTSIARAAAQGRGRLVGVGAAGLDRRAVHPAAGRRC